MAQKTKRDRISLWLYTFYLLMFAVGVFAVIKMISIMLNLGLDPRTVEVLTPSSRLQTEMPQRGNVYDCNGKLLAITYPRYQITIDCTVQKGKFSTKEEQKWLSDAREFAVGLNSYFPETSADEFYKKIVDGRKNNKTYLKLGTPINNNIYKEIKKLPLANRDAFKGGVRSEIVFQRYYPYDKLARRTLGFVRYSQEGYKNTHIGLEGKFDYELRGRDGRHWVRETDFGMIDDSDSSIVKVENGKNLHTTLNIDYQNIADRALRTQIDSINDLHDACLVLMEVETGAIRAMVNLSRATYGSFEEVSNIAIGRKGEPGSVFKTVTLMSVLNDGYIKSLEETLPATNGRVVGTSIRDQHIPDFAREHKTNKISILDGFKISSNYVFATLAVQNYGTEEGTTKFLQNIYTYKLGEAFDFDLEGLLTPTIPSPKTRYWTNTDLGSIAFGYSTEMTPLHIITYYNAIANKGKMMKPYLVDSIEKDGKVTTKHGPAILNGAICTKAVADTLTRALRAVTEEGTARALKKAKCSVAGKTGTSFGTFPNGKYEDEKGRRKYQATFVGFFPAENPKYTAICCVYSDPTRTSFQGGSIPAKAVKELIDNIYSIDPCFRKELNESK